MRILRQRKLLLLGSVFGAFILGAAAYAWGTAYFLEEVCVQWNRFNPIAGCLRYGMRTNREAVTWFTWAAITLGACLGAFIAQKWRKG